MFEIMFKYIFLFPSSLRNSKPQWQVYRPGACCTHAVFFPLYIDAPAASDTHRPKHSVREAVYMEFRQTVQVAVYMELKSRTGNKTLFLLHFQSAQPRISKLCYVEILALVLYPCLETSPSKCFKPGLLPNKREKHSDSVCCLKKLLWKCFRAKQAGLFIVIYSSQLFLGGWGGVQGRVRQEGGLF